VGLGVLKLFLLRHGETEFSRQDRFCGRLDAPLTETGREMATWFAEAYAHLPWNEVRASTRIRAVASAEPLAARAGQEIVREPNLDEIDHGLWQGKTKLEVAVAYPRRYRQWCDDPTVGAPGGESIFDVRLRALRVVEEIKRRHADGNVLLVSHKTTLRVLVSALMGMDLARYRERVAQPVCGLTVIALSPEGPELQLLGDITHLPPVLRARALGAAVAAPTVPPRTQSRVRTAPPTAPVSAPVAAAAPAGAAQDPQKS
jgi:broad specificity phosphatase PhoE